MKFFGCSRSPEHFQNGHPEQMQKNKNTDFHSSTFYCHRCTKFTFRYMFWGYQVSRNNKNSHKNAHDHERYSFVIFDLNWIYWLWRQFVEYFRFKVYGFCPKENFWLNWITRVSVSWLAIVSSTSTANKTCDHYYGKHISFLLKYQPTQITLIFDARYIIFNLTPTISTKSLPCGLFHQFKRFIKKFLTIYFCL